MAGPVAEITMQWRERLVFEAGAPGQPRVLVDGDSKVATSPVEMLLVAAATCTASDGVLILEKQRGTLRSLGAAAALTFAATAPGRAQALSASPGPGPELAGAATVVVARRTFWGAELGLARRAGGQGRLAVTAAGGSYEGALGVRCEATAQFLLRPGERSGAGPYAGLGLAFVGGEGARGAGYLTALLGVEAAPAARAGWHG